MCVCVCVSSVGEMAVRFRMRGCCGWYEMAVGFGMRAAIRFATGDFMLSRMNWNYVLSVHAAVVK